MIIGTNWFLGWSHCTAAKDRFIKERLRERKQIADILEVFFNAGVDTIMAPPRHAVLREAVEEAQDRTGVKAIVVSTPAIRVLPHHLHKGFGCDEVNRILDAEAAGGATFCLPHQSTTDALVDRVTREIRQMAQLCGMIRERGLIPGLSTHMPESIVYADETGLDVETYISIYNAMGFMMQVEVDWTARIIRGARKPVMTIKPMAAGQLRPLQALAFVWSTLRPQDMVTVGTMTPDEAREVIDLSLEFLEGEPRSTAGKPSQVELQETRSKASLKPAG